MIKERIDVAETCAKYGIPDHMWGAVERYLFDRIEPGSFLTHVLCNDLLGSFGAADHHNQAAMRSWASMIYNEFPRGSHGSEKAVSEWLRGDR